KFIIFDSDINFIRHTYHLLIRSIAEKYTSNRTHNRTIKLRRTNNEKIIQNNPPHHNGSCDLEGLEGRKKNK
ncbi:hypothetical protein B4W69_13710, partial [Staphylococcus delphini]